MSQVEMAVHDQAVTKGEASAAVPAFRKPLPRGFLPIRPGVRFQTRKLLPSFIPTKSKDT